MIHQRQAYFTCVHLNVVHLSFYHLLSTQITIINQLTHRSVTFLHLTPICHQAQRLLMFFLSYCQKPLHFKVWHRTDVSIGTYLNWYTLELLGFWECLEVLPTSHHVSSCSLADLTISSQPEVPYPLIIIPFRSGLFFQIKLSARSYLYLMPVLQSQ